MAGRLNEPEPRSHCGPVRSDFACLVQPAWSELVSRLLLIEWSQIFIKPSPSSAHWAVLDPTRDRSQLQRRAPSSSGQLQREFELVTDANSCSLKARDRGGIVENHSRGSVLLNDAKEKERRRAVSQDGEERAAAMRPPIGQLWS